MAKNSSFEQDVQAYWKKLHRKPVDSTLHRDFLKIHKTKEIELVPHKLMLNFVLPWLNGSYAVKRIYHDKNGYDVVIPTDNKPKVHLKRIRGHYYIDNEWIPSDKAWAYLNGEYMLKPSLTNDGTGVTKINVTNKKIYKKSKEITQEGIEKAYGSNFLVQEVAKQHAVMDKIHPSSVNTLRMVTLRWDGEISHLLTFARFGTNGKVKDNAGTGGVCCGVREDGSLLDFAIDKRKNVHHLHPTTEHSFKGVVLPSFDKMVSFVINLHKSILHHDYISWDIIIGQDSEPIFLELNFWGTSWIYQLAAKKPLFGSLNEELFKRVNGAQRDQRGRYTL